MRCTPPPPLPLLRSAAPALFAASLLLAGCVTERSTAPTYGLHPGNRAPSPRVSSTDAANPPPRLPDGPVARPVTPTNSQSARVRALLVDMGTVPYDGQVLPLVSPDGRFVAVQTGQAPTWPTLLAAPGAEVPHGTRLQAFELPDPAAQNGAGQSPTARQIAWQATPEGLMLGRSCDNQGFLVESPQLDGSRWIGRISWVSGSLEWLVQGVTVNAHPVLGPDGELAFTRRDIESHEIQLVVRAGGRELSAGGAGSAYVFPMLTDEPGVVYAISLVNADASIIAMRLPQRGEPATLVILGRQLVARSADVAAAYQMVAAAQTPLPSRLTTVAGDRQDSGRFDKLIYFSTSTGRMSVFDRRLGTVIPLFAGSYGAIPIGNDPGVSDGPRPGYLISTKRGLEYVPWADESNFDRLRAAPANAEEGAVVVTGGFLPRLTTNAEWPVVLMGPDAGAGGGRIHLFRLSLDTAEVGGGR